MVIYSSLKDDYNKIITTFKFAKNISDIDDIKFEIFRVFPKTAMMYKYDQLNHAHQYDLWDHSAQVVVNMNRRVIDDIPLLAAFLHDIAKPMCRVPDAGGKLDHMHYFGHNEVGAKVICKMFNDFYKDNKFKLIEDEHDLYKLYWLVYHHDDLLSHRPSVIKKIIDDKLFTEFIDVNENLFMNLMYLEISDAEAHIVNDKIQRRIDLCKFMVTTDGINYFKAIKNYGCDGLPGIKLDDYGLDANIGEKIEKFISDKTKLKSN